MADSASLETGLTLFQVLRNPNDAAGWTRFVARYGRRIYQWCRQFGAQDADAEDITQDVLLRFFKHMQTYDPEEGRFRNWLKTVTHNAWHDFVAQHKPHTQGAGGPTMFERLHAVEARDDLLARITEAFDLDLFEMAEARIKKEVAAAHWECYRTRSREGRPAREIAGQLGLTEAAVWQNDRRVRQRISEELERLQAGDQEPS